MQIHTFQTVSLHISKLLLIEIESVFHNQKYFTTKNILLLTLLITAEYFYPETNHPRVFADREDPDSPGEDPLQQYLHLAVGVRVGLRALGYSPPASFCLQHLVINYLIINELS